MQPAAGGSGKVEGSAAAGRVVARGGSWYDKPWRCRSAYRLAYPSWRKVFDVGFRVVIEDGELVRSDR